MASEHVAKAILQQVLQICCVSFANIGVKMDTIEAIIEEFEIEKLMRCNGVARFHKNIDKAVEKNQESKTEYGMLLHKTKLEKLTEAIEAYLKRYTGVKGRIPIAHQKLSKIDPEKASFIILKNIFINYS